MTEVTLYVNDMIVNEHSLRLDFPKKDFSEGYERLLVVRGHDLDPERGLNITYNEFKAGYTIIGYETEGGIVPDEVLHFIRKGNMRLEVKCPATTEDLIGVVYAEFPDVFQIDAARNVIPRSL